MSGRAQGKSAGRRVHVVWRGTAHSEQERQQAARDIVEVLIGVPQVRRDAPEALTVSQSPSPAPTTQAIAPISYREARDRVASLVWDVDFEGDGLVRVLTEGGNVRALGGGMYKSQVSEIRPIKRRQVAVVHRRPGKGGARRRDTFSESDAIAGADTYGDISWRSAGGRARLGITELSPSGNTILATRLSGDDVRRGLTLMGQALPNMALVERYPDDLKPRLMLHAINMSGKREIRADSHQLLPGGILPRTDVDVIFEAIEAGWCEHVVYAFPDRTARDLLQAGIYFRRLRALGIGLWIASWGRQVNFVTDNLHLQAALMISEEERNLIVRRTQTGLLNQGPLSGRGWLGTARFGFYRDERQDLYQDEEQWRWIRRAFDLADSGECDDPGGLSVRHVTERLTAEGCPFDHDRVRTILKDPIYATGEYTTKIRGVPISQTPIRLVDPVPLDQFQRVQNMLALRQGKTSRTPLGEFAFNYVECVHITCAHLRNDKQQRALVKGWIYDRQPPGRRVYRHSRMVCPTCRGIVWERSLLEPPVFQEIRRLATHPTLLRELALADRHESIITPGGAGDEHLADLRDQIRRIENDLSGHTHRYVDAIQHGRQASADAYEQAVTALTAQITRLQRRLDAEERTASHHVGHDHPTRIRHEARLETFLELMADTPPDDPYAKALRSRLLQRCVSKLVIDDTAPDEITIEIHGPLVPPDGDAWETDGHPIDASADLLDAYAARQRGEESIRGPGLPPKIETDLRKLADKSVPIRHPELVFATSTHSCEDWHRRHSLDTEGWSRRSASPQHHHRASWRMKVCFPTRLDAPAAPARIGSGQRERLVLSAVQALGPVHAGDQRLRELTPYAGKTGLVGALTRLEQAGAVSSELQVDSRTGKTRRLYAATTSGNPPDLAVDARTLPTLLPCRQTNRDHMSSDSTANTHPP